MKKYTIDCSKYNGWVIVDKNGIITDVIYVFSKFKGQPLSNLTKWLAKMFNYCTVKEEIIKVDKRICQCTEPTGHSMGAIPPDYNILLIVCNKCGLAIKGNTEKAIMYNEKCKGIENE